VLSDIACTVQVWIDVINEFEQELPGQLPQTSRRVRALGDGSDAREHAGVSGADAVQTCYDTGQAEGSAQAGCPEAAGPPHVSRCRSWPEWRPARSTTAENSRSGVCGGVPRTRSGAKVSTHPGDLGEQPAGFTAELFNAHLSVVAAASLRLFQPGWGRAALAWRRV